MNDNRPTDVKPGSTDVATRARNVEVNDPQSHAPDCALIVFLKAPRSGWVKTRLAQAVGENEAAQVYRRLVEHLLERLGQLPNVELRFTPDDAFEEIRPWLRSGWQTAVQGEGGLGERLIAAFDDAFRRGARRVVVVGSDCPDITREDIEAAWRVLENHDVVLGPSMDGGYWLVGLRKPQPGLFREIPWSTEAVFEKTQKQAAAEGLRVCVLRCLSDVDTEVDWREFLRRTGEDR